MFTQGEFMRLEHALKSKINHLAELIGDNHMMLRPNIETIYNLSNAKQANQDLLVKVQTQIKD